MAVTYHQFDCVIVGAGGAGLRAALESSKRASTAVVTKASSASAGRMSMHSYSLNVHLLWSGRPPARGSR